MGAVEYSSKVERKDIILHLLLKFKTFKCAKIYDLKDARLPNIVFYNF